MRESSTPSSGASSLLLASLLEEEEELKMMMERVKSMSLTAAMYHQLISSLSKGARSLSRSLPKMGRRGSKQAIRIAVAVTNAAPREA